MKAKKCTVVVSEQHSILKQQMELLESRYQEINILPVPAAGWTAEEQQAQYIKLRKVRKLEVYPYTTVDCGDIIFLSPLPVMLAAAAWEVGFKRAYCEWAPNTGNPCGYTTATPEVLLFHNSLRDRNEKDGKVWYTISQEGWELHPVGEPTAAKPVAPPADDRKEENQI